jgi:uncharacterized membrane protein
MSTESQPAHGPVQILVIGFDEPRFRGEILPELRRLQQEDLLRVVDLLVVHKDEAGNVRAIELSGLTAEERESYGSIAGVLMGLTEPGHEASGGAEREGAIAMADGDVDERDVWFIEDAIPPGSAAAVAILEHRWAIPFRDAVVRAGGAALADAWIHPHDLAAAGLDVSAPAPS